MPVPSDDSHALATLIAGPASKGSMWRLAGMQRGSMMAKAATQLRAVKPAMIKFSPVMSPMLVQYSLPKLAVRAGGMGPGHVEDKSR